MHEDLWAAVELHLHDGRVVRFGPDERLPGDRPQQIQWSSQIPGGWGDGSFVLARVASLRDDDAMLFASVRVYTAGSKTLYEGRVVGAPQIGTDQVRIETEGWSAALDDDETVRFIGVDQDRSRWGSPSSARMLTLPVGAASGSVVPDQGSPSVELRCEGRWELEGRPIIESWYRSGGLPIGSLYYAWKRSTLVDPAAPGWEWYAGLASNDAPATAGEYDSTANLRATGPDSGTRIATTADRDHAFVQFQYADALPGYDGWVFAIYWTALAVYGDHGLPLRGSADLVEGQGLYGSDVIAYALSRWCPDLNYTLGDSIETSTFAIPHLTFLDDVTTREVVGVVTLLGGAQLVPNDWGVYENREFFHKSPGTYGKVWRVRKDKIATLTSSGPSSKERTAGMKVSYRDGTGERKSVGPPGSGADFETTDLLDTDPQNPANRLGGRNKHRDIGINNQEGALNAGRMLLYEANRVDWQGTIDLKGEVTDEAGNKHHPGELKAGDRIVTEDEEYPEERNIISTSANQDDLSVRVDIGAPPNRGDVMLAQLAAKIERLG